MLKIVVVGYGEMFTNLIAGALDANCEIVGVFRSEMIKYPKTMRIIKDLFNPSLDYNYIRSYKLHEINATSINSKEFKTELLRLNPDIMLVGSWAEKISKEIYNMPKIASINAHPSLLPKYRGPNPYFWTIKNQESVSGITFHLIDDGFDTGSILAQEEVKIYSSDTGKSLKQKTVLTARGVVCELLKDLSEDIIIPLSQNEEKSTYYSHPDDLMLYFSKSAEENNALIRAIYPWSETYFYHNDVCFVVSSTNVEVKENNSPYKDFGTVTSIDANNKILEILCGNNKIIRLKVSLCNKCDRIFTKNYLKREIKIGDKLND